MFNTEQNLFVSAQQNATLATEQLKQKQVEWLSKHWKTRLEFITTTYVSLTGITYSDMIDEVIKTIGLLDYREDVNSLHLEFLDIEFFRSVLDTLIFNKEILAYHPTNITIDERDSIRDYITLFLPNSITQFNPSQVNF